VRRFLIGQWVCEQRLREETDASETEGEELSLSASSLGDAVSQEADALIKEELERERDR